MSVEIPVSTISRKRFIAGGLAVAAEFAIACSGDPILFFPKDQSPKVEKRTAPQKGDLVKYGSRYFLIRFNTYYPIPDVDFYKRATDFDKYGRQESDLTGRTLPQIAAGQLPEFERDFEQFTGFIKDLKRGGGKTINFHTGLGTNERNEIFDPIQAISDFENDPNEGTFGPTRRDLRKNGWFFADYHYNPYGAEWYKLFDPRDTARPLDVNIANTLYFAETGQRGSPLSQRIDIAHSLGTVFAFEIAMAHPDWFDILILLSPCVRGLEDAPAELLRKLLLPHLGDEKVSADLVKRWRNPAFQEELKEKVARFRKSGKRIIEVGHEDDPLSSHIEGAEEVVLKSSGENPLAAHGRTVKDKRITEFIAEVIGQKISS